MYISGFNQCRFSTQIIGCESEERSAVPINESISLKFVAATMESEELFIKNLLASSFDRK